MAGCMFPVRRYFLSLLDDRLTKCQDVDGSIGWSKEFAGGLVPCEPVQKVTLSVKSGTLPADLVGAYMRVGPNCAYWPPKKRTHVFDGDGFIHTIRIVDGKATYNCDFLETPKHQFEQKWGSEWFVRVGEFHGKAGLAKILLVAGKQFKLSEIPHEYEMGSANTALECTVDGKLWALNEAGAPFRFRLDNEGVPRSLGFDDMQGTLKNSISAHPKIDRATGEVLYHGRKLMKNFYAGRMVDGKVVEQVDLKVPDGFHHDMFITENYMVIVDGSMRFTPKGIVKGQPIWNFDPEVKLRFGIFKRGSGAMTPDAFVWIEATEAAEIVHTLYAYDEGDKIVLWTPVSFEDKSRAQGILGGAGFSKMRRVVIDVAAKTVDIQNVKGGEHTTEFPRIRDDRSGMRTRYGYSGMQVENELGAEFNFAGLFKWDFQEGGLIGRIDFPYGVVGGEAVFVPRTSGWTAESDDHGYMCLFLWNVKTRESTFAIYDAKSFSPTPVAELLVPRRVPIGFHCKWITEGQFQQQLVRP